MGPVTASMKARSFRKSTRCNRAQSKLKGEAAQGDSLNRWLSQGVIFLAPFLLHHLTNTTIKSTPSANMTKGGGTPLAHHYPIESTIRNAISKSNIYHRLASAYAQPVFPSQTTSLICR